jgi:hydroxyethylthiazole kinase-like uncharacterized protein yjeF
MSEYFSRHNDSRKGDNGKVVVIGGSVDFSGAPALSAQAALRTGSDLVRVVTSESVRDVMSGYSENLIVDSYPSDYLGLSGVETVIDKIKWSDVAVIGPGLSRPDSEAIRDIIERIDKPVVVDADAIEPALNTGVSNSVLTPHRGEAELIKDYYGSIEDFVEQEDDVVVLVKGSVDKVYCKGGVTEVEAGHPGMTVGGTGDVLTGVVASLISKGMDLEDAAVKGAEVNGLAGEKAAQKYGNGLVATDLLDEIPKTLF